MEPINGPRPTGQPDAGGTTAAETLPGGGYDDDARYTFEPVADFHHPSGVWIPPVVDLASGPPALRAAASDEADWAAAAAAVALPGTAAVWRTWRRTWTDAGGGGPVRVVLVEVERPGVDPAAYAAEVVKALAAHGVEEPLVEVCTADSLAPASFLRARRGAALLWAAEASRRPSLARSFDGVDPVTGRPYFEDAHPRLTGVEKDAVLGYLQDAPLLLSSTDRMEDILDPAGGRQIFLNYYTDGFWTWNETAAHYLRVHRLAPDPELLEFIRANDYRVPPVSDVDLHRAAAGLFHDEQEPAQQPF
jgi:hypothetical protein